MENLKIKNEFQNEEEKTKKRSKKNYWERIKERMSEYYGEKNHSKNCKNLVKITWVRLSSFLPPLKHPREQKKLIKKKMTKKNFKPIFAGTFDFDSEEYLDKSLIFDLKIIKRIKKCLTQ